MTTQAQGKSKKKNKEVTKVSLDEFNQFDAPHGHSVVSVTKVTGLDWAATMADHELTAETQQIVVPIAPRAQRGPNVDFDSLPDEPPFRASLYNLPMSVEEKDVSDRFFAGLGVRRVEISKTATTVEFESKEDLYDALSKDGTSFKGKTVNVCVFGQAPQNTYQDRFGGRGGNSPYGDRYGDRSGQPGSYGGSRMGDRYADRPGGGFGDRGRDGGFDNRNREGGFGGYQRGGSGGFRNQPLRGAGYGQRFQDRGNFREGPRGALYTSGGGEPNPEEPKDWRARPTIQRGPLLPPAPEPHEQQQHAPPPSHPEASSEVRPKSYARSTKAVLSQWLGTQ